MCTKCNAARLLPECKQWQAGFDKGCLHCGARIQRHLGALHVKNAVIQRTQREAADAWSKCGHSWIALRDLARGNQPCFAPL